MSELLFENILKSSRAYELMLADIKKGLGHAYRIVCADDDLTDSFLTLVAASVFCANKNACLSCAECRKVLHMSHADVIHVNKERAEIKKETISDLVSSVEMRGLSGQKLYLVHRADLMNLAAQNKLLKTLEEPPEGVTFLLGVANDLSLLETVRSRSRAVYLDGFDEKAIYDELVSMGKEEHSAAVAAACSNGMPGKALLIADSSEYVGYYDAATSLLTRLNKSSDIIELSPAVQAVKDMDEFLDVLSIIIRDMLVYKHDPALSTAGLLGGDIPALSAKYSDRALAEILSAINLVRKKLSLNVNLQATIDSLLFKMLEVKHKWQ